MRQYYTLKNSFKKLRILFLIVLTMGLATLHTYAQGEPVIAKDWTALPEAEYMLDVTYRIIDCDGNGDYALHLHVFNENTEKSNANLSLKVTDEVSGNFFEYRLRDFPLAFAAMLSAECGSSDYPELKIGIPSVFTADKLKVEITYH